MSPCRPAPAKPVPRRRPRPNPSENAAGAQGVVPRQLEFRQNANAINNLRNLGVQVGFECCAKPALIVVVLLFVAPLTLLGFKVFGFQARSFYLTLAVEPKLANRAEELF